MRVVSLTICHVQEYFIVNFTCMMHLSPALPVVVATGSIPLIPLVGAPAGSVAPVGTYVTGSHEKNQIVC